VASKSSTEERQEKVMRKDQMTNVQAKRLEILARLDELSRLEEITDNSETLKLIALPLCPRNIGTSTANCASGASPDIAEGDGHFRIPQSVTMLPIAQAISG